VSARVSRRAHSSKGLVRLRFVEFAGDHRALPIAFEVLRLRCQVPGRRTQNSLRALLTIFLENDASRRCRPRSPRASGGPSKASASSPYKNSSGLKSRPRHSSTSRRLSLLRTKKKKRPCKIYTSAARLKKNNRGKVKRRVPHPSHAPRTRCRQDRVLLPCPVSSTVDDTHFSKRSRKGNLP
jgi:hypothetical protein